MMVLIPVMAASGMRWGQDHDTAVHLQLDRAMTPQPGNEHLTRLSSLRALRDPRLIPLFASLAERAEPSIQMHAVLGLSELTGQGQLDPHRVAQVHADARAMLIGHGVVAESLLPADMELLLKMPTLTTGEQLMLYSGLVQSGTEVDIARVSNIDATSDPAAQAMQAVLEASLGDNTALRVLNTQLQDKSPEADGRRFETLELIRRVPSEEGLQFAVDSTSQAHSDGVRRYALLLLLEASHPDSEKLIAAEAARAVRHRSKIDLALLLMMVETAPPEGVQSLADDSPLIAAMLDTASSLDRQNETDINSALKTLIGIGHRRSTSWVIDAAGDWPQDRATSALELILDQADEAQHEGIYGAHAVAAATTLIAQSPSAFRSRLMRAADDSSEQQILLLAMLQQPTPDMLETVRGIRRIGLGPADTLTILVMARDSPTLNASDVAQLKRVAARIAVSSDLRTQAAWLAVRHDGSVDDMVATLIGPSH